MKHLYRVTYENTGIYDAFKQTVTQEVWNYFSKNINWLAEPPRYRDTYKSYFTEAGFRRFEDSILPFMLNWLDKDKVVITVFDLYEDGWQMIMNV